MSVPYKYDIKVNKQQPSDEEIEKHRNFDRILSQYNRTAKRKPLHQSLHKTNKMFPVVIVSILIMLIVYYYEYVKKKKNKQEKQKIDQIDNKSAFIYNNELHIDWELVYLNCSKT